MIINNLTQYEHTLNQLASQRIPFLFIIDFLLQRPLVYTLDELKHSRDIYYHIGPYQYPLVPPEQITVPEITHKRPISYEEYQKAFDFIVNGIKQGNSFLANLTFPTTIELKGSLLDVFFQSRAPFKLWVKDQFVVFSPEPFIHIDRGRIYTYPMKGTIDAAIPNAKERILSDTKEFAEHVTIVDLLRNDLSIHAHQVEVLQFRYIEEILTSSGSLLQVSSKIKGELGAAYPNQLGTILLNLLPAGSVSGAPKPKTLEMIAEAEQYDRGYYTGVFGIFDGQNVYSAVMIRFIEKTTDHYLYKSGGGITARSESVKEYHELIQKVYVPITGKYSHRPTQHKKAFIS